MANFRKNSVRRQIYDIIKNMPIKSVRVVNPGKILKSFGDAPSASDTQIAVLHVARILEWDISTRVQNGTVEVIRLE